MKPVKKKTHHHEKLNEEFVRKPIKKPLAKRDRKLSIYDPLDEEEEFESFDDILNDDMDSGDGEEDDY